MIIRLMLLAALYPAFAADAVAAPVPIRCDTCDEAGFRRLAAGRGPGVYLTYNLARNTVSQYQVGSTRAEPEMEVPVARLNLHVPVQRKTAFDYLADANLQAMVNAAAGNGDVLLKILGEDVIGAPQGSAGWRLHPPLRLRILFEDGSSVGVSIRHDRANAVFEPGSARTAAGQVIACAGAICGGV